MKTVLMIQSHPAQAQYKNLKKMLAYFIPPLSCNSFLALLSLLFSFFFHCSQKFQGLQESKVQGIGTAFINPDIEYTTVVHNIRL